ncbi:MAG: cobalamin biosynthesis protein P47K [Oscillospiraceae bacterium]|nr:cobalamin biosynthesis protein P47K [Oscillospiraceae bacterium]
MNILIIGGFLGSGKTTLLRGILKSMTASGQTVAVIENEIGEVGIDDQLISEGSVQVTPLFGGCVCCQISGNLLNAVLQIKKEVAPDWLVIEATGLAFLTGIRSLFERYGDPELVTYGVCVIDISRWARLLRASPALMESQIEGSDIVVVNKVDVKSPEDNELEEIRSFAPENVKVIFSSGRDKTDSSTWEEMKKALSL